MCKFRHRCKPTPFDMGAEYEGYRANMRRLPLIASTPMEATDRLAMIEATAPLAFALFGWRALRAKKKSCSPSGRTRLKAQQY